MRITKLGLAIVLVACAQEPKPSRIDSVIAYANALVEQQKARIGAMGFSPIGNWYVRSEVNPVTDKADVDFVLSSKEGPSDESRTLTISCRQGALTVHIDPDDYLGSDNTSIHVRFDAETARREDWRGATNNSALFVPGSRKQIERFVTRLAGAHSLSLQVEPYQEAPKAIRFEMGDMTAVLDSLWKVCPRSK